MSPKNFSTPASLILVGGVALALAQAGCSPISLSQTKLRAAGGGAASPVVPDGPGSIKPIGGTALGPGQQTPSLIDVPATFQSLPDYQSAVAELPAGQWLSFDPGRSADALAAFRATRSITVRFDAQSVTQCKAYFGLSLSDLAISNYGWNSAAHPVTTDCNLLADGSWKISVSQNITSSTWNLIAPSIEAVTFSVANTPQQPGTTPGNGSGNGGVHVTPNQ